MGAKSFCGEEILRKIIIIMSDAREEAAIAREGLVREKKKMKKQTTLLTKWNIVQTSWGGKKGCRQG